MRNSLGHPDGTTLAGEEVAARTGKRWVEQPTEVSIITLERLKWLGWLVGLAVAFVAVLRLTAANPFHWPVPILLFVQEALFLVLILLFTRFDRAGLRGFGLGAAWAGRDVWMVPALIGLQLLGSIITALVLISRHQVQSQEPAVRVLSSFNVYPPWIFLPAALALTLLVGLAEESLFRGYLMTRLEMLGAPGWVAIVLSGGLFGLAHWSGYGILSALSKGLWFGIPTAWYFWRQRKLGPLVAAHALLDFSGIALLYLVGRFGPGLPGL